MFKIIAKSVNGTEHIDTAETRQDAQYLATEYKTAFGPGFQIYVK